MGLESGLPSRLKCQGQGRGTDLWLIFIRRGLELILSPLRALGRQPQSQEPQHSPPDTTAFSFPVASAPGKLRSGFRIFCACFL